MIGPYNWGSASAIPATGFAGPGQRLRHDPQHGQGLSGQFADPGRKAQKAPVFDGRLEKQNADNALVYLRISLLGLPVTFVVLAGTGYLRGLQDTRTPLIVAVGPAVVNLVLELWWIFGLDFGIGASALSTVVAEALAAAVYVTMIRRATRVHTTPWRPDRRVIAGLGRAGVALFWRTAALRGSFTLATAVAARIGTAELAAHQIAFELMFLLALALDAVAIAGQALTGRYLGAGDADSARGAGRRMIQWSVTAGVVAGLGLAALSPVLPAVFTDDPEVLALAGFLILCVAALQPLNGLVFALDGILIGAGDLTFLAKAMVAAFAVFAPAAIAVLVLGLGIGWVWASLALLFLARAVVLSRRFAGDRWIRLGAD